MKMQTALIIIAIVIAGYVAVIGSSGKPMSGNDTTIVITIADVELKVWLADNMAKRAQGLSGTKSLPKDGGMLFDFGTPTTPGFWMKDMNYAIDIIWIDENLKVIGTTENVEPNTFPRTFNPPSPIRYVLEVQAGFVKDKKITAGEANARIHLYQ